MYFTEFLIIYLAIGASFGVHYFLNHRRRTHLFFRTIGACLCWIFYATFLLGKSFFHKQSTQTNEILDSREREIERLSNELQREFVKFNLKNEELSFFDFRTTLERYTGLTLGLQESAETEETGEKELEIFRLANRSGDNLILAGRCLHRKNLLRLQAHQISSRMDFLRLVETLQNKQLKNFDGNFAVWQTFARLLLQLTEALEDSEANLFVRQILLAETQRQNERSVQTKEKLETESWNRWQTETTFTMEQATLKLRQMQD